MSAEELAQAMVLTAAVFMALGVSLFVVDGQINYVHRRILKVGYSLAGVGLILLVLSIWVAAHAGAL